jgi:hypothetical protein
VWLQVEGSSQEVVWRDHPGHFSAAVQGSFSLDDLRMETCTNAVNKPIQARCPLETTDVNHQQITCCEYMYSAEEIMLD